MDLLVIVEQELGASGDLQRDRRDRWAAEFDLLGEANAGQRDRSGEDASAGSQFSTDISRRWAIPAAAGSGSQAQGSDWASWREGNARRPQPLAESEAQGGDRSDQGRFIHSFKDP